MTEHEPTNLSDYTAAFACKLMSKLSTILIDRQIVEGTTFEVQLTGPDGCLIESEKTFLTFWKGGRVPDKEFQTFERVCDVKLVSRSGKYTSTTINTI
jgi:hypothetical protein